MTKKILIATRNAHKSNEIKKILGGNFQLLTLENFSDAPTIIEDAATFAGNAIKKSVELAKWLAENPACNSHIDFILADDSGLEVNALNGAPGIHSARFAAFEKNENSADADNNSKLLGLLKKFPPEKCAAQFHCVIALTILSGQKITNASPVCFADEFETEIFDGICRGKIISAPRGKNGFGYDPLFIPDGYDQTFAELGDDVKNKISHRAMALAKLKEFF